MIAWYWMLAAFFGGLLMGWMTCSLMVMAKADLNFEFSHDNVYSWLMRMAEKERNLILYSLVKSVYRGRRTIHRCPTRKGKTINLLDPPQGSAQKGG